jgi:outer membrane protein assembly factor BamA
MVVGMDFRHYQKIHRDLILAVRVAASTSLGSRKLIYYLGGVDNWLFQRVDNDTEISPNQNYWYQALATPMRGFWVNSRNGNSMAVVNSELRWPVFKYLLNKPIKSDFVENFQIVGFADVGSAWTGLHPYSDDNEFNTQVVASNPITVSIENNREPIVYGYGFGLRSRLLGYFVRADWSWGVDDGIVLPRVFYLSLNLDF